MPDNSMKYDKLKMINLEEQKQIIIDIMDHIHSFCVENNIQYRIAYGSLIGAVRHEGFIPWDDDLDIVMDRENYEKFVSLFNKDRKDSYRLLCYENTKDYYLLLAKVIDTRTVLVEHIYNPIELGVYVDIFPIDYASDDLNKAVKQVHKIDRLYKLLRTHYILPDKERSKMKEFFLAVFHHLINRNKILQAIEKKSMRYRNEKESKYCGALSTLTYGQKEIVESEWYRESIELSFEGRKYFAPKHYDKILSHFYGDYMQLPPPEKQITHHLYDAYWRE